jgi:Na+/proline symporter
MVIVETVALAIMISNDIVMPLALKRRALGAEPADAGAQLLTTRRIAIFAILFLAYAYYRSAGDAQLAAIGLLSFAAVAQLAPAFFGGLIWRRATSLGAIAGMSAGILVWAYALLLPSISEAGIVSARILAEGPWGIGLLRPQALFGLDLPPLVHGVLLSLAANVACYIGFSLARPPSSIERVQGDLFAPPTLAPMLGPMAPPAASASRPRPRPTFSSCNTPNICWPQRSAPPHRAWCFRCSCASARSRPRRR